MIAEPTPKEPTREERASELKAIAEALTVIGDELKVLERRVRQLRHASWRGMFELDHEIEIDTPLIDPATGDLLALRRKRLRLSQKALAKRVHVSRGYLSDLESGRRVAVQTRRQVESALSALEAQHRE